MLHVTREEARILYLLAKAGEAIRKTVISQATARWPGADRDRVLMALERRELLARQSTPGRQGQRSGNFYWLTEAGLEAVADLVDRDVLKLDPKWRQQYGTEERETLSTG